MKSFSVTDVGIKRKVNQDYVFVSEEPIGILPNLFIVADGMGGHNAGDLASKYCVESVLEYIKVSREQTYVSVLESAIQHANDKLLEKAEEDSELVGMGTTFVAATVENNQMLVANIGDSRLYVLDDKITQITKDHSLVEIMVENGEIEPQDAKHHPNKNVITRAVGASIKCNPDFFEVELNEEDIVLLCSDGLSNMMEDEDMLQIVNEATHDFERAAKTLVERANDNGGKDNIAIIIFKQ